jgi:hypothetical protein
MSRRTASILVSLFVLRGIVLLCILPPFEMWDEYSHLAHVDHLATTHRLTIYGQTQVPREFLAAMAKYPLPASAGFGQTYADFWAGRPGLPAPDPLGLYEAQHPPIYYALAAPIYLLCGGRAHLLTAVTVLRLLNLTIGAWTLALLLGWIRRHLPDRYAIVVGCWIALDPLLLLDVTRVANDALAYLLGTAVVLCALREIDASGRSLRNLAAVCLLLPMAMLTKMTNTALLPVVVLAMLVPAIARREQIWPAMVRVAAVLVVMVAALVPYVVINFRTVGVAMPLMEAVANRDAGRSFWTVLCSMPVARSPALAISWWMINAIWVGGWSFLFPPRLLVVGCSLLMAIGGWTALVRWKQLALAPGARWLVVCLVLFTHLAMMGYATESAAAWRGQVNTNSWYAAVAIPWWLMLLACGAVSIRTRWLCLLVCIGVPAFMLLIELHGEVLQMIPAYYGHENILRRVLLLHPAMMLPAAGLMVITIIALQVARRNFSRSFAAEKNLKQL